MDKKNILLLGFAIVAIGLFVIPSTMSMFVGQHRWYSVRTVEQQYQLCERCHSAEVGEWSANNGAHATYSANNPNAGCFCHQINTSSIGAYGFSGVENWNFTVFNESGDINNTPGSWIGEWRNTSTPHAAITIGCEDCHYNATAQLSNNKSAHKAFFEQANASLYGSNNTACMACHTMVGLNITMERIQSGIIVIASHNANYTWTINVTTNTSALTNDSTYYPANESVGTPIT